MNPLPFWRQEKPESCVPACLRMVLASYGVVRSEADLYVCCQTDVDGTLASAAAKCAQDLGFDASAPRLSGLALQEQVKQSFLPIVYLNLAPLLGINVIHAVIVEAIDAPAKQITVIDPTFPPTGRREWSLDLFEVGWRLARQQVILIAPRA